MADTYRVFNDDIKLNWDYNYEANEIFKTEVSQSYGGWEQRKARYEKPIKRYTLPFNNKYMPDIKRVLSFFRDMKGRYGVFLFYDPNCLVENEIVSDNYKELNVSNEVTAFYCYNRFIKPLTNLVVGTDVKVKIAKNTVIDLNDPATYDVVTAFTVTQTSGKIILTTPVAKTKQIMVTYEYYTKVRFDSDTSKYTEITYKLANTSLDIIEVR